MGYNSNVFYGTVRKEQAVLVIETLRRLRSGLNHSLHQGSVFGMGSFDYETQRRLYSYLNIEDAIHFFGPIDSSAGYMPPKTAGVAQPLGFCQVSLVAL